MATKKLGSLLNSSADGDLGNLVQRAQAMGELADVLSRALDPKDRLAIVAANLREDGELVIICASSAWASRLRYETDTLLAAAQSAGIKAHTVRVRVSQS